MKRICKYLMTLALFTVFISVDSMLQTNNPALTVEASELDYKLLYTVEQDGTASITGYEGNPIQLVIPSEIDGYPVSKIDVQVFATSGEELYNNENSYCSVEALIIEDGVTEIEFEAFLNCKDLTSVTLPSTLNYVWDMAFCGCDSLKEIKIPSTTGRICEAAFGYTYECNYIEGVYDYEVWTEKMNNFTIYGEEDSTAETYANENGFTFIALDDDPDMTTTTTDVTTTTTDTATTTNSTETITETSSTTTTTVATTDETAKTASTNSSTTTALTSDIVKVDETATAASTETSTNATETTPTTTTTTGDATLPQTGYSKWYHVVVVLAACMTGTGAEMVIGSGVLKRKQK